MRIPFVDLASQHKEIENEMYAAIKRVIDDSDFILGRDVALFEKEFAGFCGCEFAVGVSSGTAALFLAALSAGLKPGDEAIVPDFTYIATALAVSYTGAKPVFVDVEPDTYCMDISKLKKAITNKTRVIIPVHLYGQPANMPEIVKIAREYGIKVIEDAAQAHGARINSTPVGAIGDIGCFSFYPSKNMGALGDGGMVVTKDEETYNKLLMLRDYGRVSKYEHSIIGYNSRLDTLQAAVLRLKLKKIDGWNSMRRKAAAVYDSLLSGVKGVITPRVKPWASHVYHCYAIRAEKRDELAAAFKDKGIGAVIHYPIPIHMQKAYSGLKYKKGDFPVSEETASKIISLPMFPHITEEQIKAVAEVVKSV